jgi:hypothetical protein
MKTAVKVVLGILLLVVVALCFQRSDKENNGSSGVRQPVSVAEAPEAKQTQPASQISRPRRPVLRNTPAAFPEPVRNTFLSLEERAEREQFLNHKIARATNLAFARELRFAEESIETWNKEMHLRDLSLFLQMGMTPQQATNVMGVPSQTGTFTSSVEDSDYPGVLGGRTNGAWHIYSPHPKRIDMGIGHDFRVLELWFNPAGELADAAWVKPVRN